MLLFLMAHQSNVIHSWRSWRASPMNRLILAAAAFFVAAPAYADSIPISINFSSTDPLLDLYTQPADFTLPAGFTNASLNITSFAVDDRGVLQLNGSNIASTGIFCSSPPCAGNMVFTAGGNNDPFTFQNAQNTGFTITSGFVTGPNTLRLIVNDTGDGIFGNLNPNSQPTSAFLSGTVTFNVVSTVPLPGTLPLFATGLGALGLLGWRRKRKAQAA
jgi:PEP-CTERM motif-containing protein